MATSIDNVNLGAPLVSGAIDVPIAVTELREEALEKTATLGGKVLPVQTWGAEDVSATFSPGHIKPLYNGPAPVPVAPQVYLESSLVADGSRYMYDSYMWRLPDNTILFAYWTGNSHTDLEGRIMGRIINDNFEVLRSDFVIADDALPYDTRNIAGGVLDNGRIVIFYRLLNTVGVVTVDTKFVYSDDYGDTWTPGGSVEAVLDSVRVMSLHNPHGKMVKTSYGYMQTFYSRNNGVVLFSQDGLNWGDPVEQYYIAEDLQFGEGDVVAIDEDRLVMLLRCNNPDNSFSFSTSSDGGRNWTAIAATVAWTSATVEYGCPIRAIKVGSDIVVAWGGRRDEAGLYANIEDAEAFWTNPSIAWLSNRPNKFTVAPANIDGNSLPVINFGYPNMLLRTDGSVALTWYDQNPNGFGNDVDTKIGTILDT